VDVCVLVHPHANIFSEENKRMNWADIGGTIGIWWTFIFWFLLALMFSKKVKE